MSADEPYRVVCQVCGEQNPPDARYCIKCNAALEITFREQEKELELEKVAQKLPDEVAEKVREMEEKIRAGDTAPGPFIRLANIYSDHGMKDRAIEYLAQAVKLNPSDNFLKQKLEFLEGKGTTIESRIHEIEEREAEIGRYSRIISIALGVLAVVAVLALLKWIFFPSLYRLVDSEGNVTEAVFSPDGTRIAYLDMKKYSFMDLIPTLGEDLDQVDSKLMVASVRGGSPKTLATFKSYGGFMDSLNVAWVPGSDALVYVASEDFKNVIVRVDLDSGETTRLGEGSDLSVSHDGRYLAYVGRDQTDRPATLLDLFRSGQETLYVLDLRSGERETIVTGDVSHPRFSPVRHEILYLSKASMVIQDEPIDPFSDAYDEDIMERLMMRSFSSLGNVFKYDLDNRIETALTSDSLASDPAWLPDGNHVAYKVLENEEDFVGMFMIAGSGGENPRMLLGNSEAYSSFSNVTFRCDCEGLAFEASYVDPDRPTQPVMITPLGPMGGGDNMRTDIFLMRMDGRDLRRYEVSKHPVKYNPRFSTADKRMAYEIQNIDGRRETWITREGF